MSLSVQIGKLDLSGAQILPPVRWTVERMEWRAVGGPMTAQLRAEGRDMVQLQGLTDLIRCPVTINDDSGPAWWGYVASLELHSCGRKVRISLDKMADRVAVAYRDYSPVESGGSRLVSGWSQDVDSINRFGKRERIYNLGQATATEAAACAETWKNRMGKPDWSAGGSPGGEYVILECRGWWETLNWCYYTDLRGQAGNTAGGATLRIGDVAGNTKAASYFVAAEAYRLADIWLKVGRYGLPGDAIKVDLCANNGGIPGTVLASASLAGGVVWDATSWTRFTLAGGYNLTANTTYWLVVSRSGALDPARFYNLGVDESLSYTGAILLVWNGSAWVSRAPDADLAFQLTGTDETTAQLVRLLAAGACGQFISGYRVLQSSGVWSRCFRDGFTERGQDVAEELLSMGTSSGARLLARVDQDRTARIYAQPAAGSAVLYLGPRSTITGANGRVLQPSEWAAGQWVRLADLTMLHPLPAASAGYVWVEACAYENGVMRII